MLAKNLTFLASADAAGIVLGARVPIILTSRADSVRARLASCAVAALYAHNRRRAAGRDGGRMTAVQDAILVVNAGSSSIKFELFASRPTTRWLASSRASSTGIGTHPHLDAQGATRGDARRPRPRPPTKSRDVATAVGRLAAWLREPARRRAGWSPSATAWSMAARITPRRSRSMTRCSRDLETLVPLAPLHQPNNLAPIRAMRASQPELPAGRLLRHRVPPRPSRGRRPLRDPGRALREGVRRYGFHGLSYEYIAERAARASHPRSAARPRGRRASGQRRQHVRHPCRPQHRQHDGLHRAGRPADGHPPRPARPRRRALSAAGQGHGTPTRIERLLYHDCGLKGLSGISNDMRDLLASDDPGAALAVDYFVYRIAPRGRRAGGRAWAGSTASSSRPASASTRPRSARGSAASCAWLGVELDAGANARQRPAASPPPAQPRQA